MDAGKRAPAYQLLAQSGPGLSALPWSLHGAGNGTGRSPATDRGKKSVSAQRNMREEGGMQGREAGAAPDVVSVRTMNSLTAFWWGSGPQMLLVQQPDS